MSHRGPLWRHCSLIIKLAATTDRRGESAHNPDPADFLPLPHLPYGILIVLLEEARHGWTIIKRIEELNDGRSVASAGSLYLAIARLEERGLIEATRSAGSDDARRRVFRLTSLGRRVVKLESARLAELIGIARHELGSLESS